MDQELFSFIKGYFSILDQELAGLIKEYFLLVADMLSCSGCNACSTSICKTALSTQENRILEILEKVS